MGRPAWANDKQWTWLKSQATEYLKIKGKKKETKKFWPVFFDSWKEQWPQPALSDTVHNGDNTSSATLSTTGSGDETGAVEEQQSATAKKAKKPLTVSTVRTASPPCEIALTTS